MEFGIGLAQSGYPDRGDVIAQARAFAAWARRADCRLLVFPEDFMWPRPLDAREACEVAEPVDGPFVQAMGQVARQHGLWTVFTMNERNPEGANPFNTAVVLDDAGDLRGLYRKCHLYDAHGVRESARLAAGDTPPSPIETPFCTIGLGICYDLRFPELARAAALAGCDMLVFPSAWHAGSCKGEHWETLLRARAIENELFVAGVCRSGEGYVGRSLVADPLGRVLCQGAAAADPQGMDTLVVCRIDPQAVAAARASMPVFSHRRPGLYGSLARAREGDLR